MMFVLIQHRDLDIVSIHKILGNLSGRGGKSQDRVQSGFVIFSGL